jgi:23S rRNA (uracil1939-C5)-methyltransferase
VRKRKNVILEKLSVENYAAEGKSIARHDGKVVFIESVVPGDLVDVRLFKNKKDWAEGYPVKIHEFSKDRVQPFCQHFGVCGGCQWQMLPYEKQLQYKQKQVEETLKRIGKIPLPPMLSIAGAEETRFYRNKLEYTFGNRRYLLEHELTDPTISAEENVSGYHAKGIFDKVVSIQKCWLQPEPTNELRLAVTDFARKNDFSFYDVKRHAGFLRMMQVRMCTNSEIMVNIVFGNEDQKKTRLLLDHVLEKFPVITTLLYTINQKWNDSLNDLQPVTYHGKGYVTEKLTTETGEEFQFKIGPISFFQTNSRQAEKLYRITNQFAELKGDETIYDLYCGTGSIGIFLSKEAKKIIGVESIQAAVQDAWENARLNNISDAEFYAGDVIEICNDDFFQKHGKPDVIISDPPRAGMHEKLVRKILEIEAPVVVYVSCNPATQARDLNILGEKYSVTKIQPVDMFPHTHHIEAVAQLKLK